MRSQSSVLLRLPLLLLPLLLLLLHPGGGSGPEADAVGIEDAQNDQGGTAGFHA